MLKFSQSYLMSQRNWYTFYSSYSKYSSKTKLIIKPKESDKKNKKKKKYDIFLL